MHCGCKCDHVLHFSLPMNSCKNNTPNEIERIEDLCVRHCLYQCSITLCYMNFWPNYMCVDRMCVCVCLCLCHCNYCKRLKPPVKMVSDATTEIICQGEKLFLASANERRCICFPIVFASSFSSPFTLFSIIQELIPMHIDYCVTVLDWLDYWLWFICANTNTHMFAFVHGYNGNCNLREIEWECKMEILIYCENTISHTACRSSLEHLISLL